MEDLPSMTTCHLLHELPSSCGSPVYLCEQGASKKELGSTRVINRDVTLLGSFAELVKGSRPVLFKS